MAVTSAAAQTPFVRIANVSRPGSDFQIGDRYEVLITASPNQPVSVRTARMSRVDWGPVIGQTDSSGRWSVAGQFTREDFGSWNEVWTVGGNVANPVIELSVNAPCLKGGEGFTESTGCCVVEGCETAAGSQTFVTPSGPDPFRTPDGRVIPGAETNQTAEQYHAEITQYLVLGSVRDISSGLYGDEAAAAITKFIGVNALKDDEVRNVLAIVRTAFADPQRIPESAKNPAATRRLLQHLSEATNQSDLKQQIAETVSAIR
jgi:hypothetical protein